MKKVRFNPSPIAIARIIKDLGDEFKLGWKPVWRQLLPILASEMGRTIRQQGRPINESWQALQQATLTKKSARGAPMAALHLTGELLATVESISKGKIKLTKTKVEFGPKKKYQFVHNFGAPKRGIPERRYIGLTTAASNAARHLMNEHAAMLMTKAADKIEGL